MSKGLKKGCLAIFSHPDDVIKAAKKLRHLNITKMDAFSPFPIHGLDPAMGIKKSWISKSTLMFCLAGGTLGFIFQCWTTAYDWNLNIGGKPPISWPSFIPVTFETTILFGGVSTALLMFAFCFLYDFGKPTYDPRFTDDRFGLLIEEADPHYGKNQFDALLKECNAEEIKYI